MDMNVVNKGKIMIHNMDIEYGDIRFVEIENEFILVKNGEVEAISKSKDSGVGVRILLNGRWGFSSSSKITEKELMNLISESMQIAAYSDINPRAKMITVERFPGVNASYTTKIVKDPFSIPLKEKIDFMLYIDSLLRKNSLIKIDTVVMSFTKKRVIFANSEMSFIDQTFYYTGAGYSVFAMDKGEIQRRSYPAAFGGNYRQAGYEFIEELNLVENVEKTVDQAVALLKARPSPRFKGTLILESNQTALQLHESIGHPLELDRILGYEVSYAGDSFVNLDMFGKFRYGSSLLNVYADATVEGGLGSFMYDDEGIPAQRIKMIERGILMEPLTSRETAAVLNKSSNGAMRASSWNRIPLIRMTNINIEPGNASLDDMISDVKEGVLMETNKSWSIDNKRLNFQFGTEVGWYIKNGKIVEMVKNPIYWGITPEFWNNLIEVGNKETYVLWGIPNCGKGEPGQSMFVGHGVPAIMVKDVEMGNSGS